jgi:hypothetical protein
VSKRVSPKQEIANRAALSSFIGFWRDSADYDRRNFGNTLVQMAVRAIHAACGESAVTFETQMLIKLHPGQTDGNILLLDTDEVKAEDYHMEYSAVWQTYALDSRSQRLVVSGLRFKDKAPYTVQIQPLLQDPD